MNDIDWDDVYLKQYKSLLSQGVKYTYCISCVEGECIHKMDVAKMAKSLQEKIDRKAAGQCGCVLGEVLAERGLG
jgi:hypothetical protein